MGWRFLIDRGGTFTDVIARAPDGSLTVRKWLSRQPDGRDPVRCALAGHDVDDLRLGTTVATNALLERQGERVLLLTTRGFADLGEIGTQQRPDIFALQIRKRVPLHAHVIEIDERILADGTVERAPDVAALAAAVAGFDSVAVLFLHAWINPAHERLAGTIARAHGVRHVTLSHQVDPEIGAVARGDTTLADAYLTPLLARSLEQVRDLGTQVRFMKSSGGLADARHFSGKDAVLSGPAGGVVAVAEVAALAGVPSIIGLDMGGTSTDVCRFDGTFQRTYSSEVGGVHLRAPMLDVVTVAAGGGSILAHRDGRFVVGPESAGAEPGPACYGRGGPATITDANLVLGRIHRDHFPHLALDVEAARAALAVFGEPRAMAAAFVAIANENMAAAIRTISTARGQDARDDALCAFGGAGGQHACALARLLGMSQVLVHPLAGVQSAWGIGLADVVHHEVAPVIDGDVRFPDERAAAVLADQGFEDWQLRRSVDARYVGTDDVIVVPWSEDWPSAFTLEHERRFGFVKPDTATEIVAARVEAVGRGGDGSWPGAPRGAHAPGLDARGLDARGLDAPGLDTRGLDARGLQQPEVHEPEPDVAAEHGAAPVWRRGSLRPGARLRGPALITDDHATLVVDDGFELTVEATGLLRLRDRAAGGGTAVPSITAARDPMSLEVMSNRFMAIATQMGEHLRRVAHSTSIKERLDFSCALFDAEGGLVANAPHIPVHLGAMGETVRQLLERQQVLPGDAWLVNDPYHGGSHLPDLTVISPVFRDGARAFMVANRGHHADVGGPTPGSMPADSRSIDEEGVLFEGFLLVRDGRLREDELREAMQAAGVRNVPERLADLRAQIAANAAGARLLDELCEGLGTGVVRAWMGHVHDNAAEVMGDVVRSIREGSFEDGLDDGSRIAVSVRRETVGGDVRAIVDFTGTSPQQPGNRNAPRAVAVAAVLYVFRTLAKRPIPLNAGCLLPLEIRIPEGSLLDPRPPAAVVGGNVETSQRVVDVLLGALGELAACQGTMNNITFGDETFGYYETICGGAGAGLGFDGADAVHTHMTNTRLTDPEILEQRHPVVLREFSIRRGSGGRGTWHGGDGVVRRIEFLRPLTTSVLAERRLTAPFGLRAESGHKGEHEVTATTLFLATPGGGGFTPDAEQWATMSPALARRVFRQDRFEGSTEAICVDHERARLLVVHSSRVEAAQAAARAAGCDVLHRSRPGDPTWLDEAGSADLSTDLPRYEVVEPSPQGLVVTRRPASLGFAPDDVALLLVGGNAPVFLEPHRRNAPDCRFLLGARRRG